MKFTDGNWLLQPGVVAHYPAEAHDAAVSGRGLVFHAPVRPIRHRGDTLQGPLLTVRIDSPMSDVIHVRIEHFSGAADAGPHIPLFPEKKPKVSIKVTEKEAILRSGGLSAHVSRGRAWGVSFQSDGRTLTSSGARAMGYIEWPGHGNFVHEQLALGVGECVYGLGERFTALVKNGQVIENWNKDGGTSCDQAYKSVPFYLTNRGYGVLVNETGPVSFEVASEKLARVQFSVPGQSLEYFVINGPDPKAILSRLTALTGRPALPPAWSFGLWLTTSFTTELRREDRDQLHRGDEVAGPAAQRVPFRLLLDARVRLVRLPVGLARVPRSRGDAAPAPCPRPQDLRVDQPVYRASARRSSRKPPGRATS